MTESELELHRLAQQIGVSRGEPAPIEEKTVLLPEVQNGYMVCVLASGSSGNATFIRYGNTRVLIDAGISYSRIKKGLESTCGCTISDLDAIFITHEHTDHVAGLPMVLKHSHVPICTTLETWQHTNGIDDYQNRFMRLTRRVGLGDIQIVPFSISHDAAHPVGYTILSGTDKVTFATDLGYVSPDVEAAAAYSDILILESNHDEELLRNGPYPAFLQNRILGALGHLSNTAAAELLTRLPRKNMMKVFLAHRSEKNNTPTATVATMRNILGNAGICIGQDLLLRLACQKGNVRFQEGEA